AAALAKAEEARSSWKDKLLLTSALLHGEELRQGEQPVQDATTLFRLRDGIVHMKLQEVDLHQERSERTPNLVRGLQKRGLAGEATASDSWIMLIATRAVARWACKTAEFVVWETVNGIQDSFDPLRTLAAVLADGIRLV